MWENIINEHLSCQRIAEYESRKFVYSLIPMTGVLSVPAINHPATIKTQVIKHLQPKP